MQEKGSGSKKVDWVIRDASELQKETKMPRPPRADVAGHLYHALNRGNQRDAIFHTAGDYEAFERVLNEGLQKFPVD